MMWLLFFGFLFVMAASISTLAWVISERTRGLASTAFFEKSATPSFRLFVQSAILAMSDPAPSRARLQSLLTQEFRLRHWRSNLLWLVMGPMALWLPVLLTFSIFRLNSHFVLGFAGLLLAFASFVRPLRAVAWGLGSLGVFLWTMESSLRSSSSLLSGAGQEVVFWLADGRALSVLLLLILAAAVSALSRIQFFFFCLSVVLLAMGWVSLSGAVALWMGERLGLALGDAWRARGLREGPQRMVQLWVKASLIGTVIGFVILALARGAFEPSSIGGGAAAFGRLEAFVWLSLLVELPVWLSALILGHLASAHTPDDLFSQAKAAHALLDDPAVHRAKLWLKAGLLERQGQIQAVRAQFGKEDWEKVPPGVREASQKEAGMIEISLSTGLSSGMSGFPDPLR